MAADQAEDIEVDFVAAKKTINRWSKTATEKFLEAWKITEDPQAIVDIEWLIQIKEKCPTFILPNFCNILYNQVMHNWKCFIQIERTFKKKSGKFPF